jgi:hypothetical protein
MIRLGVSKSYFLISEVAFFALYALGIYMEDCVDRDFGFVRVVGLVVSFVEFGCDVLFKIGFEFGRKLLIVLNGIGIGLSEL